MPTPIVGIANQNGGTYVGAYYVLNTTSRHHGRACSIIGIVLVSLLALVPAQAQPYANPEEGHRLATTWCIGCDLVEPRTGTRFNDPNPSFYAVAQMPSTTVLSLSTFLRTAHVVMPDLKLTDPQIDDLAAYILGLRAAASK